MAHIETQHRTTTARKTTSTPVRPQSAQPTAATEPGTRLAFYVMMALLGLALLFFITLPFVV